MFLFQTASIVAGAQANVAEKLSSIPAEVAQRIASGRLAADDRTLLNATRRELYAAAGGSDQLLSSLAAICKDKGASPQTRQAAAFFYGNSISLQDAGCMELEVHGKAVNTVLKKDILFTSLMAQFGDRAIAKIGAYGAEEQFTAISPLQSGAEAAKGADFSLGLPKSVPMNTSYGGTKVYFEYNHPFANPPGIRLTASLPTNMDFSVGTPGSPQFGAIYNFFLANLSTTSYASLAGLKEQFAPLVDAWLNAPFSSTQSVRQLLATNIREGHSAEEFVALFKNFRTAEAFGLLKSTADPGNPNSNKFYTSFGVGKMQYNTLVTNVVQSEFAKRASGKISTQTSITVDLSKKFSILGYFDYNNVNVQAVEELPGKRVSFFDAGGMLLFHVKNLVIGAGGGYQWGKASIDDVATIPLNAFNVLVDVDKTIPLPKLFKIALQGNFRETFYDDGNAFSSARLGGKVSKTIPIALKKQENMVIKSMDLDIYVNPFVDLGMSNGTVSKDFTIRTGIDLRKIPIPKGFMTVGAYYDVMNKDVGGIRISYHF